MPRPTLLRSFALVLALLVTGGSPAHAGAASDSKPGDAKTESPAVALGATQLADLAHKAVLANAPLPAAPPPAEMRRPGMPGVLPSLPVSRSATWPAISPALGAVPRDAWRRLAARKPADVTVTGPRVLVPTTGGAR